MKLDFLERIIGRKKQKFYKKQAIIKHDLEDVKKQWDEISRVENELKNREKGIASRAEKPGITQNLMDIQTKRNALEARRNHVENEDKRLYELISKIESQPQNTSFYQKAETTGLLYGIPKTPVYLIISVLIPISLLIILLAVWSLFNFSIPGEQITPIGFATSKQIMTCETDKDCIDIVEYKCRNGDVYKYTSVFLCLRKRCVGEEISIGLRDTCREEEVCVEGEEYCQKSLNTLTPWEDQLIKCDSIDDAKQRNNCLLQLALKERDSVLCNMIESVSTKYRCFNELGVESPLEKPDDKVEDITPLIGGIDDSSKISCDKKEDCPDESIEYTCDGSDNVLKKTRIYYCAIYSGSYCVSRVKSEVVDICSNDLVCTPGVDHCTKK